MTDYRLWLIRSGLVALVVGAFVSFQNCSKISSGSFGFGELKSESIQQPWSPQSPIESQVRLQSGQYLSATIRLKKDVAIYTRNFPHLVSANPDAGLQTDGPPHPWKDDQGNGWRDGSGCWRQAGCRCDGARE